MKRKVTKEEYLAFFKSNPELRPVSTFSDPTGTSPYGLGRPAMDTDWGCDNQVLATCEMRKDSESDEWEYEYYLWRADKPKNGLMLSNCWENMDLVIEATELLLHPASDAMSLRTLALRVQQTPTEIGLFRYSQNLVMEVCQMFAIHSAFRKGFGGYSAKFSEEVANSLATKNRRAMLQTIVDRLEGQEWNGVVFRK